MNDRGVPRHCKVEQTSSGEYGKWSVNVSALLFTSRLSAAQRESSLPLHFDPTLTGTRELWSSISEERHGSYHPCQFYTPTLWSFFQLRLFRTNHDRLDSTRWIKQNHQVTPLATSCIFTYWFFSQKYTIWGSSTLPQKLFTPDSLSLSLLAGTLRKGGFLKVKAIPATVPISACSQFMSLQKWPTVVSQVWGSEDKYKMWY